ncbi:divergent polysaccharide deacetylase family protein [bacterium]|nr:divergent polysaccharide deacetylase family protein [bacterium]
MVSLVTEQPAGNTPPASPQVTAPVSAETEGDQGGSDVAMTGTDDAAPADANAAPRVATPQVEVTQPIADTTSAAVPAAPLVSETLVAPAADVDAPQITAETEDPVLPNPQSMAPQVPENEQDLTISTQPAAVPEPVVVEVAEAAPMDTPTVDIAVPMPIVEEVIALPEADAGPQIVEPEIEEVTAPKVTTLAPSTDQASSLPSGDSSVKVNRIVAPEAVEPEVAEAEAIPDDAPAIVRYAAAFENPENKPLMSVVLIDDGIMNGAVSALKSLTFPVTVVLDPSTPNVIDKLKEYRDAGIEVGVRSALPAGAAPSDVEIAFEATFSSLPDTVMLFDAGDGGLQNDRAVIDQALADLAKSGRGLVSVSSGLNTATRAAEKLDVPAGLIYRDLDGDGQDARVIRRFMDQAAFRARQESGVILLARIRPDTISALQLWGTANRAGDVALAPVSAILTREK